MRQADYLHFAETEVGEADTQDHAGGEEQSQIWTQNCAAPKLYFQL